METRRAFSRTTIAAVAGTALSASRVWGANDRVRMGLIGAGGRGREDWGNFLKQSDVDPVAVCDVYDPFREKGNLPEPVEFDIPQQATASGTLTLEWTRTPGLGGNGRGTAVSEVGLIKVANGK